MDLLFWSEVIVKRVLKKWIRRLVIAVDWKQDRRKITTNTHSRRKFGVVIIIQSFLWSYSQCIVSSISFLLFEVHACICLYTERFYKPKTYTTKRTSRILLRVSRVILWKASKSKSWISSESTWLNSTPDENKKNAYPPPLSYPRLSFSKPRTGL